MAKNVKMVVTDLDGTLLSPEKEISREAVDTIAELKEKNIRFTFITGRPPYAVKRFAERVEITAPIICCNGAVIFDKEKETVLAEKNMPFKPLIPVLETARSMGMTVLVLAGGIEYALSDTPWTKSRREAGRDTPICSLEEIKDSQICKVNIMADGLEQKFMLLAKELKLLFDRYSIAFYGESGCEIVAKGVDKEKGLRTLCEICGISMEEVLAVGDNANDHEMLKAAGIGAVVANGTEDARKYADYLCERSFTDGVVEAIRRFAG